MTDQEKENHFYDLLRQGAALSDEDIQKLLSLWSDPTKDMVRPHITAMFQGRMALEQIRSIRLFDKASGDLVGTTNTLTRKILVLTVLVIILGVVDIVATAWPYLTWWICHGFRFH